ncbi:MAG: type II toxin-antitoxin system VapC family toxin [Geminicoccaceae bacterium]
MTLIIDTSAVLAIVFGEPEAPDFMRLLAGSTHTLIATGSAVELFRLVHVRFGVRRWKDLDRLFALYAVVNAGMDERQLGLAKDGMRRFGQGRGAAPAVLNFGDLFAYALARSLSAPLLYKGDDFSRTDVIPAWRP